MFQIMNIKNPESFRIELKTSRVKKYQYSKILCINNLTKVRLKACTTNKSTIDVWL